jgi:hypothetical protein
VYNILLRKREYYEKRQEEAYTEYQTETSPFESFSHGVVEGEGVKEWGEEADTKGAQNDCCLEISLPLDLQVEEKAQVNEKYTQYNESENAVKITL